MADTVDSNILFLPQDIFFIKIEERPLGINEQALATFSQTQVEMASPLPSDILRWGYCVGATQILTFTAAADRLSKNKQIAKAMETAEHALPLAALLWGVPMQGGWNLFKRYLENGACEYLAVNADGGKWISLVSLSLENADDALALSRLSILGGESISGEFQRFEYKKYALGRINFSIESAGETKLYKVGGSKFFKKADVRDTVSLRDAKRKLMYAKLTNYAFIAALAVFVLCAAWQFWVFSKNSEFTEKELHYAEIEPSAQSVLKMRDDVIFLSSITGKKMHNTLMLAKINAVRPDGITFNKASALSAESMELRGKAPSVSSLSKFETDLRLNPEIKKVDKKISQTQSDGSVWVMNIQFKEQNVGAN